MNEFLKGINYLLSNSLKKGFFHLLSANLLIQIVSVASQLFVAGILSPEDIGRIKIIQTYLSIFIIFAGMGFNSSTLKLCSENRNKKEQNQIFFSALFFTLITTTSLYLLILILNYFNLFSKDKLIQYLIPLGLFPIISNSIFMVFVSFFQSIKKISLISNLTITNKIISIISIVFITYFAGIKGYYIATNISFILMLIVCIRLLNISEFKNIFTFKNFKNFSLHWKYAKNSMFAYLLSEISAYIDIIIIGYLCTEMNQIGFYSFALTITVILKLFPSTVQQITIPYLSALIHDKVGFQKTFIFYNKILYLVVFLTLGITLLIFPPVINWAFNSKYIESFKYFPYLAIGWSLRQLVQLQNGAIFSLGKIHYNVYISFITLLFNIIAVSLSIYYFGLIGAAYASVFGGFVFMISSRFYYKKAQLEM